MNVKKICVTGDKGFIGRALKNELERLGYIVLGLESWIFDRPRWQDRLHEYLVNLSPDVVFHVGACSDTLSTDVNNMMKLNVECTHIISDWCQFKGIPFIFSSSASVYGNGQHPENLYAWSKYMAEQYVTKCGGISLRYFNVYGMDERGKGKMASMIYQIFEKNRKGEEIKLFPNNPTRDFVYVKDVVSANIFAWKFYSQLKGSYYDVGTCESRSFEDICNSLNVEYTYTSEEIVPKGYQMFTQADQRKLMIGWKADYNLEKGIEDYLYALRLTYLHF
jgi:ADP-L-glycero-D-manno-heptose 6-epimerase